MIGHQTKEKLKETIAFFIRKHKITKEVFDSIVILSETWLHESVKGGEAVDETGYNLKSLFRLLTQNDNSVFYGAKVEVKVAVVLSDADEEKMRKSCTDKSI